MASRFGLRSLARTLQAGTAALGSFRARANASAPIAGLRTFTNSSGPSSGGFSYNALLESHPIATKSVTSMFVVGGGDWICQKFIEKREKIIWSRVATMATIGLTLCGPLLHAWFGFLFRTFPGTGLVTTLKKIACDQLIFAPLFNPLFIGYLFLLEGRPMEIVNFLKNDWFDVTVNNWKLWAPANGFNFTFVPGKFQVLFANLTGVVWNCYISWESHRHGGDNAESTTAGESDGVVATATDAHPDSSAALLAAESVVDAKKIAGN